MTDEVRAAHERAREYRDFARREVGRVFSQYRRLKHLICGGSRVKLQDFQDVLGRGASMSDARCWVFTIDLVITRVDRAIGVPRACLAVGHRILCDTKWSTIAENLGVPVERSKEVVTDTIGLLFVEFMAREITEHYRNDDLAA